MKDFDHLMSVWQEQPAQDKLSVDDVLKQIRKDVKGIANKLRWSIMAVVALLISSFTVLFFLVFNSWVTYAGILIMMFCMIMYFSLIIRHYRILNKHDATINPTDYLVDLHTYQKERGKVAGWFFYIFVLLISLGLFLYFYEVTATFSVIGKVTVYGITVIWLLFCTFYLKRRIFLNEEEKLNVMIDRLERLKSQFE
jgi:membrane protein YdbS with pleckstrin-like domain